MLFSISLTILCSIMFSRWCSICVSTLLSYLVFTRTQRQAGDRCYPCFSITSAATSGRPLLSMTPATIFKRYNEPSLFQLLYRADECSLVLHHNEGLQHVLCLGHDIALLLKLLCEGFAKQLALCARQLGTAKRFEKHPCLLDRHDDRWCGLGKHRRRGMP